MNDIHYVGTERNECHTNSTSAFFWNHTGCWKWIGPPLTLSRGFVQNFAIIMDSRASPGFKPINFTNWIAIVPLIYHSHTYVINGSIWTTLMRIYYQPNGKSGYTYHINAHVDIVSTGPSMESPLRACHATVRLYWRWPSPIKFPL